MNRNYLYSFICVFNSVVFFCSRLNPIYGIQLLINRTDILNLSTFNRFKPVKVLIHGFGGNGTDDRFVSKARDCNHSKSPLHVIDSVITLVLSLAYLLLADFNVIAVDWSSLAEYPNYARAAVSTTPVGTYVANFLDFLISQDTPPSAFHVNLHISFLVEYEVDVEILFRSSATAWELMLLAVPETLFVWVVFLGSPDLNLLVATKGSKN